ncbi:two-component system sensor histidine kinase NtrB [Sphingomonas sp. ID0503]|uniref:two-component system sensor histidine kinase NtrB n=1 Tax=Sphingomonas sp. ID0503 TaxID=3399691 RepID=UPI003AFAD298
MALPGSGLIRFGRAAARASVVAPAEVLFALPTPVLVIDAVGLVTDANVAAESLLNLGRSAVIGRSIAEVIGHPLDAVSNDAPFTAYDLDISLPDGREKQADVMVAPLPDRPGWRAVTIHGRAPSHLASRRLEREGGMKSAVGAAAMLAHEIKNPLSGIRGAAQLLEATADADSADLTRLIRDEVDRIAALIDRMEGFTDTRPVTVEPQNIHAILGHVRDVASRGFARDVVIRELYDPSLPAVLGHRDSLIQVFLNLIKNAVEAMGEAGGVVTLTTAYRHGVALAKGSRDRRVLPIEVCVIDEGPGAPADLAQHMFDPFVTTKRSGGGLGLALVDKLMTDQGGMVEYAREGRPPRTVFRVLLPRVGGKK